MTTRQIELPRQLRAASIEPASYDSAENTVDVVWTTGATVRRRSWRDGPYDEVLAVTPEAVRLDRLNAGAPFLNTHSDYDISDVIGCVVRGSARIANGRGIATIKLSSAPGDADNVQKIKDGIVRSISAGYVCHAIEVVRAQGDGVPVWNVVDWEPMELSACPISADPGAQTRTRSTIVSAVAADMPAPEHYRAAMDEFVRREAERIGHSLFMHGEACLRELGEKIDLGGCGADARRALVDALEGVWRAQVITASDRR
jgi:hypothetical protein